MVRGNKTMKERILYEEYKTQVIKIETASEDFVAGLMEYDIEKIRADVFEDLILAYQCGKCSFDIEDSIGHYLRSVYVEVSNNVDGIQNSKLVDVIIKYSVLFELLNEHYDGVVGEGQYFTPRRLFSSKTGLIDKVFLDPNPTRQWDFFSRNDFIAACNILDLVGVSELYSFISQSRFNLNRKYYDIPSEWYRHL